jgi:hypothetical protein
MRISACSRILLLLGVLPLWSLGCVAPSNERTESPGHDAPPAAGVAPGSTEVGKAPAVEVAVSAVPAAVPAAAPAAAPAELTAGPAAGPDSLPAQTSADSTTRATPRQRRTSQQPTAFEREARARELFAGMSRNEKLEFLGWFESECELLQSFQNTLLQWVLKSAPDPSTWSAPPPLEWFDPQLHAPAQPIPRRWLAEDDPNVAAAYARMYANVPARRAESGWEYDYAAREPRRLPEEEDPDRVLRNALLGLPPGWDYAEALVEGMLDDGALQKSFAAFQRVYTDRYGNAYPGITLYDAWASRSDIEMPDVDALGLIHAILDDWTTWKAVVANSEQAPLYARLGELFFAVHRQRGLRGALARAFLCGSTELRDGYQNHLDRFHALWEEANSTPSALAQKLPDSAAWASALQTWTDEMAKDELRLLRGVRRRYFLDANAEQVRTLLFQLLDQYQLDRSAKK